MISYDDFAKVEIRVGIIIAVEEFPRARVPSYKAQIDFGAEIGQNWTSMQAKRDYTKDELLGRQVVAVVNFPPKNIAGFLSEVLVLGAPTEAGGLSLLMPSHPAQIGGRMY